VTGTVTWDWPADGGVAQTTGEAIGGVAVIDDVSDSVPVDAAVAASAATFGGVDLTFLP
jgi:hypothetical protein